MKTKGIPFWEQHLEHMVLALAVLILLGFAALQFVGSPNSVSLPQGKQGEVVGPATVDGRLQEKATGLLAGMSPEARSDFKFPDAMPQAQKFEDMKSAALSPLQPVFVARANIHPLQEGGPPPPGTPFVVAKVPAPFNLLREQYFDMLLPEELAENPDLKKFLGEEPYDVTWNTIAATFKVGDVLRQFKNNGPNGEAAIPLTWFNDRVDFIDVKVEREEMADGNWTNAMILDHIPGQFDLRPTLASAIDRNTGDTILSQVSDSAIRSQIIQPEFYKTKNSSWTPPDKEADKKQNIEDPIQAEIADIKSQLADKVKRRNAVEAKMKANNCPAEAPPKPAPGKKGADGLGSSGGKKSSGGTPAPGSGGGVGEGGSKGLGRDPGGQKEKASSAGCDNLRHSLQIINGQIAVLELRLQTLQGDDAEKQPEKIEEKPAEAATPDEIAIWAHDLTIQPGKTYRYRFTVEVYNPLFAQKIALIDSQKPLAEKFTFASQTSEWSVPIEVQPWMRLFVTRAQPQGGVGNALGPQSAQATAEIYRYRAGRWWLDRFNIFIGDRVGQVRDVKVAAAKPADPKAANNQPGARPDQQPAEAHLPSIDYRTDWFVLDVIEDLDADSAAARSGLGASVMLQSLTSPSLFITRSPRSDASDPERRRLADEVKSADFEKDAVASTSSTGPGGVSGQ